MIFGVENAEEGFAIQTFRCLSIQTAGWPEASATAMIYDPQKHQRRSIRLKGYDYTQPGAYFVTICTQNRESLLGEIVEGEMMLNEYGQVVVGCWIWLAKQYPYVELDEWVVMPNHAHSIVILSGMDDSRRGGSRTAPTTKSLGRLVGAFKTVSTKRINQMRHTPGAPVWQRNYYEHIIRDEDELNRLRQYILDNPVQWEMDENNPNRQVDESSSHKTFSKGTVGAQHAVP